MQTLFFLYMKYKNTPFSIANLWKKDEKKKQSKYFANCQTYIMFSFKRQIKNNNLEENIKMISTPKLFFCFRTDIFTETSFFSTFSN